MDYRITDTWSDPPGLTEQWHVEKLVYLPEMLWCYWPFTDAAIRPERSGPEQLTFGCLNKLAKVTDEMLGRWSEILQALPGARLLLLSGLGERGNERVRSAFRRRGVDPARVTLAGRQSALAYYQTYHQIDICLDTYPFTGLLHDGGRLVDGRDGGYPGGTRLAWTAGGSPADSRRFN